MVMVKKEKEALVGVGVGLGALALLGLAVGTEKGRKVTGAVADGLVMASRVRSEMELAGKRLHTERSKELLDLEMELAEARARGGFFPTRRELELEGKIEVLKRAIERGY